MDRNEEGTSGLEGETAETEKWKTDKHTPKAIVRILDMWDWNKDQTHHKRIEDVVEDDGLKTAERRGWTDYWDALLGKIPQTHHN